MGAKDKADRRDDDDRFDHERERGGKRREPFNEDLGTDQRNRVRLTQRAADDRAQKQTLRPEVRARSEGRRLKI